MRLRDTLQLALFSESANEHKSVHLYWNGAPPFERTSEMTLQYGYLEISRASRSFKFIDRT